MASITASKETRVRENNSNVTNKNNRCPSPVTPFVSIGNERRRDNMSTKGTRSVRRSSDMPLLLWPHEIPPQCLKERIDYLPLLYFQTPKPCSSLQLALTNKTMQILRLFLNCQYSLLSLHTLLPLHSLLLQWGPLILR